MLLLLQDAKSANPASSFYGLLEEGGLLMGSLLVIYGQHRFYRWMVDKLEEKHKSQVEWLEGELESDDRTFRGLCKCGTPCEGDALRNPSEIKMFQIRKSL